MLKMSQASDLIVATMGTSPSYQVVIVSKEFLPSYLACKQMDASVSMYLVNRITG